MKKKKDFVTSTHNTPSVLDLSGKTFRCFFANSPTPPLALLQYCLFWPCHIYPPTSISSSRCKNVSVSHIASKSNIILTSISLECHPLQLRNPSLSSSVACPLPLLSQSPSPSPPPLCNSQNWAQLGYNALLSDVLEACDSLLKSVQFFVPLDALLCVTCCSCVGFLLCCSFWFSILVYVLHCPD